MLEKMLPSEHDAASSFLPLILNLAKMYTKRGRNPNSHLLKRNSGLQQNA